MKKTSKRLAVSLMSLFVVLTAADADSAETVKSNHSKRAAAIVSLSIEAGEGADQGLTVHGSEALRQLIVTGQDATNHSTDLTRSVKYVVEPAGVASVNTQGLVTPRGNGSAKIKVIYESTTESAPQQLTASIPIVVRNFEHNRPINFAHQVVPILTKYGCNGGGCHGAANGQNGFALSLLGFEPAEDYDHLVKESRGRRLSLAAPDQSLFLRKATGTIAHGGGARIELGSPEYNVLRRWIAEGAQKGDPNAATMSSIEVFPGAVVMKPQSSQQLLVIATYDDGSKEDVTATAVYEANVSEMASVTRRGLVTTTNEPGDVGVMVRYQSQVAVFRATIPLGAPVETLPPKRNFIDELVFKKLELLGLPPSPVCDDATFLRRVTLDLAGRLPTIEEARSFLADTDSAKRDVLIDELLASNDYATFFANKWSTLLKNQRVKRQENLTRPGTFLFHHWIRRAMQENLPYDQFVRQILTASGEAHEHPAVIWYRHEKDISSQVEDVAQLFLGQRIQCAKCHHHPFERWSESDYYSLSAFFSRVGRKAGDVRADDRIYHRSGLAFAKHPRTGEVLHPRGLGGETMEISADVDPRVELMDWMTKPDNPFFAKALTNRYWKHFFGRGLVDPEDDMRATNPPVNPELLDQLAEHFVQQGFDLKDLIRTICQSSTYQLSSLPNDFNQDDRQNFSRFYPRRLNAEILLDAVDTVTGTETRFSGMPAGVRAVELPDSHFSSYFLTVFGRPQGESVCECERGNDSNLAQSLHLINSADLSKKIADKQGTASRLSSQRDRSAEEKIRELYLTVFSRNPKPDELAAIKEYLQQKQPEDGSPNQQAYEDVVWSLINTKEFLFNH